MNGVFRIELAGYGYRFIKALGLSPYWTGTAISRRCSLVCTLAPAGSYLFFCPPSLQLLIDWVPFCSQRVPRGTSTSSTSEKGDPTLRTRIGCGSLHPHNAMEFAFFSPSLFARHVLTDVCSRSSLCKLSSKSCGTRDCSYLALLGSEAIAKHGAWKTMPSTMPVD